MKQQYSYPSSYSYVSAWKLFQAVLSCCPEYSGTSTIHLATATAKCFASPCSMLMSPNYPQLTQAGGKEGMSHPPPLGKGRSTASHGVNFPRVGCCCTLKSDNRKVKRARSVYLRVSKVASGLCLRPPPWRAFAPCEVPTTPPARRNQSPPPPPEAGGAPGNWRRFRPLWSRGHGSYAIPSYQADSAL